jgi:hypothetical protein
VTLNSTYSDRDARSFEERRDEAVSIAEDATDLSGREQFLRLTVHRWRWASDQPSSPDDPLCA